MHTYSCNTLFIISAGSDCRIVHSIGGYAALGHILLNWWYPVCSLTPNVATLLHQLYHGEIKHSPWLYQMVELYSQVCYSGGISQLLVPCIHLLLVLQHTHAPSLIPGQFIGLYSSIWLHFQWVVLCVHIFLSCCKYGSSVVIVCRILQPTAAVGIF